MSSWIRIGSIVTIASVAIMGLVTTACEEISNAATIKVPITVTVHPESINPSIPQTDVDCYDLSTNKDYNDNKDQIEGGELKSAAFQIIQLDNPTFDVNTAVFSSVSFTLMFDPAYEDPKVYQLGNFTNISLASLLAGKVNVPLNDDVKEAINLIAKGRAKWCINAVYGPFVHGPGSADYLKGELDMTIDFTAKAL